MSDGALIALVACAAVILALLTGFAVSTAKSIKGKKKEYEELEAPEENDTVDEETPKPEQKRGVVIDKKCEVLKEGLHVPYVESVWAIQIAATDGTTDSCFVNEETFASVNKGDAVTYFKEGEKYYINGVDENDYHEMTLDAEPFEKIRDGEKTIELRLNDEKRQKVKIGDKISFTLKGSEGDYLMTKVVALHKFSSFKELYASLPLEKCGYSRSEAKRADSLDMRKYYTAEDEARYGVVGIELELDMDL